MSDECTARPGGYSAIECANEEIQKIVDEVKPQLEEKENKPYNVFVALKFRMKVPGGGGRNYLIKVSVSDSDDECVHLEVFESLPYEAPELIASQTGKTKGDELTEFE